MAQTAARHSRFWLYAPLALLALAAVAWSVAWFVIRNRTSDALDRWIAQEASAGRRWSCDGRQVAGYPFRIEIICPALVLQRNALIASLGRVEAVAQVYQPRHVITEIDGPLRLTDGTVTVEGTWQLLMTSVHDAMGGPQRISIVAEAPSLTISGAGPTDLMLSSRHFEAHFRPNPARTEEKAFDVAIAADEAKIPPLDALVGGGETADLRIDATATQVQGFRGRPVVDELERWREAGGKLDIRRLSLVKGPRQIEAKGTLQLDPQHRPAGRLEIAAAGLEGLIGEVAGSRAGGNLLGALLGQGQRPANAASVAPPLVPMPPLRLEDGRLLLGPFTVPRLRLPPLY
jgi:hypothetical protein